MKASVDLFKTLTAKPIAAPPPAEVATNAALFATATCRSLAGLKQRNADADAQNKKADRMI
jgi:hypothetical protein